MAGGWLDVDEWRHVQTKAAIQQINKSFALLNHFIEINFINNEFLDHTRIHWLLFNSNANWERVAKRKLPYQLPKIRLTEEEEEWSKNVNSRSTSSSIESFRVIFGKRRKSECLLWWWVVSWTIAIKVCFLGMWRYLYWPSQDLNKDIIMDWL